MAEKNRMGWLYANRSGLLWRVVGPVHLKHWQLETLPADARHRRVVVRSNDELDAGGNWERVRARLVLPEGVSG